VKEGKWQRGPRSRHTWMLSTHKAVMALTLVGVTPGAFRDWRDWSSESSSAMAAMIRSTVADQTRREKGRDWTRTSTSRARVEWAR
jgi:hypothetical protein